MSGDNSVKGEKEAITEVRMLILTEESISKLRKKINELEELIEAMFF